jgi:hypothetical protein
MVNFYGSIEQNPKNISRGWVEHPISRFLVHLTVSRLSQLGHREVPRLGLKPTSQNSTEIGVDTQKTSSPAGHIIGVAKNINLCDVLPLRGCKKSENYNVWVTKDKFDWSIDWRTNEWVHTFSAIICPRKCHITASSIIISYCVPEKLDCPPLIPKSCYNRDISPRPFWMKRS